MTAYNLATRMQALTPLLKKIRRKIYFKRTLIFFAHDLKEGHRRIKPSSRAEMRQFKVADLPSLQTHFASQMAACGDFLKQGHTGFAAFSRANGDAISMVWSASSSFTDRFYGCRIDLQEGEVFQMAGECAEPFRGTPVTGNLQYVYWDYWEAQGKSRMLTLIQDDNVASIRFSTSAGFREIGKAIVIHRILGVRLFQTVSYDGERFTHHRKQNRNQRAGNVDG